MDRFLEIRFVDMIGNFSRYSKAPHLVYELVDILSQMSGANSLVIKTCTRNIILDEHRYRGTIKEIIALQEYNSEYMTIEELCNKHKISRSTYYRLKKNLKDGNIILHTTFKPNETKEIVKLMNGLKTLFQKGNLNGIYF